jgi:hypothetical protein
VGQVANLLFASPELSTLVVAPLTSIVLLPGKAHAIFTTTCLVSLSETAGQALPVAQALKNAPVRVLAVLATPFLLKFSKIMTNTSPFALSLSKCRTEECAGLDRLRPHGVWCRD